ncbi:natural resistance-associated macrophage protein-domain-containing protein [Amylocarpus encephaloides]|uniref:Natural resistance-associated macrophage protein-domain-containing protein n=1 Tax=Amylocarpus encephaloides TaxID=45428 RepID=A0A9P7YBN7_9HELO|nr:natural resistance-associated macrophage protein-domain-containing protein [Amylocarpus encephaloides]
MNCPSRTEEPECDGMNQNPSSLSADLTTREDLNGIANARMLRRISSSEIRGMEEQEFDKTQPPEKGTVAEKMAEVEGDHGDGRGTGETGGSGHGVIPGQPPHDRSKNLLWRAQKLAVTFARFIGPGFMIAVAYIDPGNYATGVAAGATYKFKLLFIVLMSNLFAIFLQSLCVKLGSVSGLNLAESCRAFLPWWLNIFLYVLAEGAIIATDIAEVIGTAIAINLLIPKIPLVAGCALSIADVLLILLFYKPNGTMKGLRAFEFFVMALVLGVVICFCIQLSLIENTSVGEVFRGYLPSSAIVQSDGLYQSCGILGATVMPHSLYLGSGIVQPRLREYDVKHGLAAPANESDDESTHKDIYYPSLSAINFCLKYSIAELIIALFTFALFVNSAILITAGASLYGSDAADADLFGIYDLLSNSIGPAAGKIFALALLLSGVSAGIVCTIAGQMVSEGALNWTIAPWMRRLITRSISITPSIIIAGAVGRPGLSAALNGSQVALSVALPFISAPLIYFTCRNKYMTVGVHAQGAAGDEGHTDVGARVLQTKKMRNHWVTAAIGVTIWLIITVMNVANLVLLGKGEGE